MNYVVYDLETNGINVLDNSIMQMTVIATDGKVLLNEYVFPFDGIIDAVHIHKIDEKKLKDNKALTLYELCSMIKKIIRDEYGRNKVTWVAYNNFGFDQIVLERGFKLVNNRMPDNWYFMDLLPLVKDKFKDMKPNYKLATVYSNLIDSTNTEINYHSSLDDSLCLLEIFMRCMEFKKDFMNYTRDKLHSVDILKNGLNKLLYYRRSMNFEFHNIKTIGDLYNLYKSVGFNIDEFKIYMKNELDVTNTFFSNNIVSQINSIHELNK